MIQAVRHRGPDGFGYHTEPGLGLAHARLSIIDLSTGQQPLTNEDRTVWVTFNGEIFNYIELRRELQRAGHVFRTQSDTEVLVHAYEEYGLDFVQHLNGQFAFAIWDSNRRRLLLVRDRVGILPLFHAVRDGRLLFASEIKALLPAIGAPERLSAEGLDQVLTFWSTLAPRTLFPGVAQLEPGHMLVAEGSEVRVTKYWEWSYPEDGRHSTASLDTLTEELRALLIDATRLRLRADVPVGAYLSGGLDSSIITTVIRQHTSAPLRTFSIGFDEPSMDETAFQRTLIESLRADHSRIHCSNGDVAESFSKAVWHAESVVPRTAMVPMHRLSSLVHSQGYRVVLTGEGSDEVFSGYDIFKETKVRRFWAQRPSSTMRPALLARLYPYLQVSPSKFRSYAEAFFGAALQTPDIPLFSHLPRWTTTSRCKEFFSDELKHDLTESAAERFESDLPNVFGQWHWLNRAQYLECLTLLPGYLLSSQGDRMLMANSVEGRFPFLDHRVIEFARAIPPRLLIKGLNEKYLLKRAFGRDLPETIVSRPKQPFRAPGVPSFFEGTWADEARDLLAPSTVERFGYFDAPKVERLVAKIEAGRAVGEKDNMALVSILSTQLLHRQFVEARTVTNKSDIHQCRPRSVSSF
jgi:asparagine synthase (glutamine-hydrolysing)